MELKVVSRRTSSLAADDDHPYRTGAWRPQTTEFDAVDLDVEGELPNDIEGVYLRNTENPLRPPIRKYHPFDGDGMIHAVTFKDGRASYRNRFVRTVGLLAEEEAGQALWAGIAENPQLSVRSDGWGARGRMKDASSTDVVVHNGIALSSFWQCGDLYQMDPLTLDDLGRATWGGAFPSELGVSAHARVDEHTGELFFFNYGTREPYLHFGTVDRHGVLSRYEPIELPGPRLPHDLAFTEHYAVLNDLPLFWDGELLERGMYASRFHRDLPSRLGLLPRDGSGPVRWFEFEPTYVLHWVNAFEEGDEVVVDGFFQGCPEPEGALEHGPADRMFRFLAADALETRLHRWRMDLVTGATKEEDLSDRCSEFGTINGRHRGRPYRHTYATVPKPGWFVMQAIVHHDTVTGQADEFRWPEGVFCSETAVAPRVGSRDESDGYLVTLTIDTVRDRSDCVVFDAARLSDGPIATARLPERISSGTHSFWAPASHLPGW
ncbi:MAG TPA: carotenoid oxygenase family protein [Acidimicrobiales bacterium]|nr:carotenoid oxygenase family protein [Acidimicrobiales bacterium]